MTPHRTTAVRGEVLHMHVPGDTMFLGVVRTSCVAATSLAIDDYDRLHDLRLAVEELAVALLQHAARDARLGVRVTIEDHRVGVEVSIAADPDQTGTPRLSEVAEMVVSAIAAQWEITRTARTITAQFTLAPSS